MKKNDLYRLLNYQDTSILIQLLEENNDYFKKWIQDFKNNKCEINIKYIIYLTIFSKMIINILKNRFKLNDIK